MAVALGVGDRGKMTGELFLLGGREVCGKENCICASIGTHREIQCLSCGGFFSLLFRVINKMLPFHASFGYS